jgi:HK97 family phage major capsid protein
MNLEEMIADARTKAEGIIASADAENNGVMSSEQTEEFDGLMKDVENYKKQIDSRKKFEGISAELEIPQPRAVASAHVEAIKSNDPMCGFKSAIDFFETVKNASLGRMDDRLGDLRAEIGSDESGTWDNPAGGFFIPGAVLQKKMLSTENDYAIDLGKFTTKVPMDSASVKFDARVDKDHSDSVTGGIKVYRRKESETVKPSKTKFEQVQLDAEALMGKTFMTYEQMKFSAKPHLAMIQKHFAEAFRDKLNIERLYGNGVGEYLGIFNSGIMIEVSRETAGTITYKDVVSMYSRCYRPGKGAFVANQDILPELACMVNPAGNLIFTQDSVKDGFGGRLFGRPLIYDENLPSIGGTGDMIFVNMSEYLEGTLEGLQTGMSIHVRFEYNENCYKFYMSNAGAPWWKTTLKLRKSAKTLSPFVSLKAK